MLNLVITGELTEAKLLAILRNLVSKQSVG